MKSAILLGLVATGSVFVACGRAVDICDDGVCIARDTGSQADGAVLDGGGADVFVPPGCSLAEDPRNNPECVKPGAGIFVSPTPVSGVTSDGTRDKPFSSIGAAVVAAAGKRIFVCGEKYDEQVAIGQSANLYGGLDCVTWQASVSSPVTEIAPAKFGYALDISGSKSVYLQDFKLVAQPGTKDAPNSIAARVVGGDVTFKRVQFASGEGAQGAGSWPAGGMKFDGLKGDPGLPGVAASAANVGIGAVRMCLNLVSSAAGNGGSAGGNPTGGGSGLPSIVPASPLTNTGAGGSGGVACSGGLPGSNATAPAEFGKAALAGKFGTVKINAWVPSSGGNGQHGATGQGGGGGGATGGGSGGSGSTGGCGGTFGLGGEGGGASIGLLSVSATVSFVSCSGQIGKGGEGGKGGDGGEGGDGNATLGGGFNGACGGGMGGKGGKGGAGAGGTGGLSVGVLYIGNAPAQLGIMFSLGGGGQGGEGAEKGLMGEAKDVLVSPLP